MRTLRPNLISKAASAVKERAAEKKVRKASVLKAMPQMNQLFAKAMELHGTISNPGRKSAKRQRRLVRRVVEGIAVASRVAASGLDEAREDQDSESDTGDEHMKEDM